MSTPLPLSNQDALFLDVETEHSPMHVAICLVFESGPTTSLRVDEAEDRILGFIESRLADQPRYRQRLAQSPLEGRPVWVDDPGFDLREHVQYRSVPLPGHDEQLRSVCAEIVSPLLDREKPLWEVWLLDGLEDDRFALIMKAHHCLVDGVAGIGLLRAMLDAEPTVSFTSRPLQAKLAPPRALDLAIREIRSRIDAGLDLSEEAIEAVREPRATFRRAQRLGRGFLELFRLEFPPASQTPLDSAHGGARRFAWIETELERIEEICAIRGGTLNDVVVATITLTLEDYLEDHGVGRMAQNQLDLRVAVPVDRRDDSLGGSLGNHISMIFARIPAGDREPLRVLEEVQRSLAEAKRSHVADALESVMALASWTPRFLTRGLTRRALSAHIANLVVTNIRGPSTPLYLLDAHLEAAYPVVPLMPEQALGVAVLSYAGTLYWGFNADRDGIRDVNHWAHEVERAFDRLHRAATRIATKDHDGPCLTD